MGICCLAVTGVAVCESAVLLVFDVRCVVIGCQQCAECGVGGFWRLQQLVQLIVAQRSLAAEWGGGRGE